MKMLKALVLSTALVLGLQGTAQAKVTFRNLTSGDLYYSQGYKSGSLWVSTGWTKIPSGTAVSWDASRYVRIITPNSNTIVTNTTGFNGSSDNSSKSFWQHPTNGYIIQEGANNPSEVYNNGVRTTVSRLESKGFLDSTFRRYNDGKVLRYGSYWKEATKTLSFSHSTSGTKTQSFSYLNNRIIDFTYAYSSTRGVKVYPLWSITADRKSVGMYGAILQGGPWYDPWRPSLKGTVTLTYIYR